MKLLTANRLIDGRVVWLAAARRWTDRIDEAAALTPEEAEAALAFATAQATVVVGAYLVDLDAASDIVARERLKETIRSSGPTVGSSRSAA